MTTLLKKDYQYSSVLWEEVMQRVQEIIRDEYNISPYVSPTLNRKTPSPFRIWSSAQGTETLYAGAWHKEYTISVNHYLKTEDSERFYKKLYQESERLYQLFFNNQGTQSTEILGFFGGEPEGIQITQEGDYFRIEVLFTCQVFRADDVVYVVTAPSSVRASTRAIEKPYNFWSLDFDGTDDYIDCGSNSSLDDIWSGGGTLSAWVNCNTASVNHAIASQAGNGNQGWFITLEDYSTHHELKFNAVWGGDDLIYHTGFVIPINTWTHIVVTYNSDTYSNEAKVYLNGSEVATTKQQPTSGNSYASAAAYSFEIGRKNTGGDHDFIGAISEVSLFNSILSSSAISSMYNNGQPLLLTENQGSYKSSSNLVAYYRMGSGEGDVRGSGGLVADQVDSSVGSELIDDPTFADADNTTDSTWGKWRSSGDFEAIADSVATFSSNTLNMTSAAGTPGIGEKDFATIISGRMYKITCEITSYTSGYVAFTVGNSSSSDNNGTASQGSGGYSSYFNTTGTVEQYILTSNDDPLKIWKHDGTGFTGSIKNFSVKLLSGNPGALNNFNGLDFRTNVPQIYDKALFSNSLVFDGVDDYIQIGDSDNFSFGDGSTDSSFSISGWINMDSSDRFRIITKTNNNPDVEWNFCTISTGEAALILFDATDLKKIARKSSSLSSRTGEWIHIVATYNGTKSTSGINIYIDGQLDNDSTIDSGDYGGMHSTDSPIYIGMSKTGTSTVNMANGNIADVAIYNTVLNQDNVTAIYNSGKPIDLTCDAGNYNNANNMVGYWKMGDGYLDVLPTDATAGTIMDQVTPIVGEGNIGTTVNMNASAQSISVPE